MGKCSQVIFHSSEEQAPPRSDMANCGPACTVPSCDSTPIVGLGSTGCRGLGWGYGGLGYGGLGWGYGGLGYGGLGYGYGSGAQVETSGNLGTLSGVIPQPINQIPPSEVVIQPPPSVVTIPGAILSASCEPTTVGGNTPCAIGGTGIVGSGFSGGYGYGRAIYGGNLGGGLLVRRSGRRGSVCWSPC
ncbi:chorion class B protein M2410-like [Tiliqua scincoides]|uniref:chorion class B protein M2410-like n=1 Tax=Tiliqua scincoides TaxID=71010 RepID=UPI0034625D97